MELKIRDQVVLIDDEDFRWLKWFKWIVTKQGYAACRGTLMHRAVMDTPNDMVVDHINQNKLDNRKSNLRICTREQNNRNRDDANPKNKTSDYKGVQFCLDKPRPKPWRARIRVGGRGNVHLGYFFTQEEAAIAYDDAAARYHGEFASLNFQRISLSTNSHVRSDSC